MIALSKISLGFVLALLIIGCQSQDSSSNLKTKVTDSLLKDKGFALKQYDKNESNPLFVFVGEKIEVISIPSSQTAFDNRFKAKYKVIQKVFGEFLHDTIEFVVYDHTGIPEFSKYKNVLLFVSEDSGFYYHQKYMFNDVYKTMDGRWAGAYEQSDYEHENNKHTKIKPVKIDFAERVSYPIKMIDEEGKELTRSYPKPYYKTVGDTAYAVYGSYIDDLFKLQRDGILTAREIFVNGKLKN